MTITNNEVRIPIESFFIYGNLNLVKDSKGLIIFAHGSGSGRFSARNKFVADILNKAHFSTFLFDLLTAKEEQVDAITREFRFNIPLLADRLILVTRWIQNNKNISHTKIGYFGASTGAAAALIAAAKLQNDIAAVVSRGGRPDLANEYLAMVSSPTLLIVGELDYEVITLNEYAYKQLTREKKMIIIPGATHLFEEKGTLEVVAQVSIDWFNTYM